MGQDQGVGRLVGDFILVGDWLADCESQVHACNTQYVNQTIHDVIWIDRLGLAVLLYVAVSSSLIRSLHSLSFVLFIFPSVQVRAL
jgi:hypothetical protein